jgi:hypothetical protein
MAIIREEPDLRLAGLSIWVLGRQFADYDDYWDGNWLNVRVRVEATGAVVEAQRPIIHVSELVTFATELERLDTTLVGNASLKCTEPNLDVAIQGETHGHATVRIKVTPDHMTQSHEFVFFIDQTYFKPLIAGCRKILSDYPIKGIRDSPRL